MRSRFPEYEGEGEERKELDSDWLELMSRFARLEFGALSSDWRPFNGEL